MYDILATLDIKSLLVTLTLGNLTSIILIATYYFWGYREREHGLSWCYGSAKLCQAAAYALIFWRGSIPDFFSVNLGTSLLATGFCLEAISALIIVQENARWPYMLVAALGAFCLVVFNIVEFFNDDVAIRTAIASLCIFAILVVPVFKLLFGRNLSVFKRLVGCFYLFFISVMVFRAIDVIKHHFDVHAIAFIQGLTFLSMIQLLVFSMPAYLLLMKESSDRRISTMARTDSLTGLSNRRSFLAAAAAVFSRHKQAKIPLAILFWDIDNFKRINDTHGHAFGDGVLIRQGEVIRKCLRLGDLSCRYGGEEFVVLLPDTDVVLAHKIAQRVVGEIAASHFPERPGFAFTVSMGVISDIPDGRDKLENFIKKADVAMYRAKNTGKDKIVEYCDAV